jgi:hypothetical protein
MEQKNSCLLYVLCYVLYEFYHCLTTLTNYDTLSSHPFFPYLGEIFDD